MAGGGPAPQARRLDADDQTPRRLGRRCRPLPPPPAAPTPRSGGSSSAGAAVAASMRSPRGRAQVAAFLAALGRAVEDWRRSGARRPVAPPAGPRADARRARAPAPRWSRCRSRLPLRLGGRRCRLPLQLPLSDGGLHGGGGPLPLPLRLRRQRNLQAHPPRDPKTLGAQLPFPPPRPAAFSAARHRIRPAT